MGENSGMAIAALVLGILTWVLIWVPILGQILAILAIVFGIIAMNKIKKDSTIQGKGMAIAGIVLGAIGIIISLLVLVGMIAYFGVLSPTKMIPDKAVFSTGFSTLGSPSVDRNTNSFSVELINGRGAPITLPLTTEVTSSNCDNPTLSGTYQNAPITTSTEIPDGGDFVLTWTCNPLTVQSGELFQADVTFYFVNTINKFTEIETGSLTTRVN